MTSLLGRSLPWYPESPFWEIIAQKGTLALGHLSSCFSCFTVAFCRSPSCTKHYEGRNCLLCINVWCITQCLFYCSLLYDNTVSWINAQYQCTELMIDLYLNQSFRNLYAVSLVMHSLKHINSINSLGIVILSFWSRWTALIKTIKIVLPNVGLFDEHQCLWYCWAQPQSWFCS